jgi:peptidoglycan-associated lipoprotein
MRASIIALAVASVLSGCGILSQQPSNPVAASVPSDTGKITVQTIPDERLKVQPVAPETVVEKAEPGLDLQRSVYYEFDQYDVKPQYRTLVERHAAWLRDNPRARLMIVGNTDERGTSEYNLALGQRRAESVTRLLVLMGAREEQVEAVSFGKEKPRAAGHDETAWTENRRSDFTRP